jgi:hypothetical protein
MQEQRLQATGDEWVKELLAEINSLQDASEKIEALLELTSEMLPSGLEVLQQALDSAHTLSDQYYREAFLQALDSALKIESETYKTKALSGPLLHLPPDQPHLIQELLNCSYEVVLSGIAPHLPPETFTLRDLTHEIFNLIRSFSFVGEIGEDPEDYRQSGLANSAAEPRNPDIQPEPGHQTTTER